MTSKSVKSSLAKKANRPRTGVGSGIPANQALAGAADPKRAAAAAADPEEARRQMEEQAQIEAKLASRREQIYNAWQQGLFRSDLDEEKILDLLKNSEEDQLKQFEEQAQRAELDQIDEDELKQVQAAVDGLRLQPDDPGYQYAFDKILRARIEQDLEEIDFGKMVFDGYAEQEVQVNNKLVVSFRTIGTQHALWIERKLHEASGMAEQYGRHWFSTLQLAISVQQINGKDVGSDLNQFDEEAHLQEFWKAVKPRAKRINKFPTELTDLLIANMAWFSGRVRKEIVGDLLEKVGNS
tara:strand:- start:530 stop:1417 length:888 start_codon:yes stop_codon:yes gene_type:complete